MTTTRISQSSRPSNILLENNNDSQARASLLQQHQSMQISSAIPARTHRTPSNLLELKQQRLLAAADRKKRLITRIISIVGLLIILLCAAIVALTLKMAPKIDELVRTKAGGPPPSLHHISRSTIRTTTTTTTTARPENSTMNGTLLMKSTLHTQR